jgi:alpha-tubulin suppressor-like RCC1 family protein
MITTTKNMATIGKVMALGLMLATLLAMLLSSTPVGAAVPSGKAFAWGGNEYGELGNGTSGFGTETNTPAVVSNLSGVKSVKAGHGHGLALMNNGTVRAWGLGGDGQLGNGTFDSSDVPVKVKNLTDVKAIAAGYIHSLALKENGSVWAWGYNYYGELGNGASGDGADRNVPVKVANLGTGVKAIAAGDDFSLALTKDGTVKSWGTNEDGQLGNGATLDFRNKPGPVSGLRGVKAIATDSDADHVLALLNNGRVKSWGANYDSQLGNGTSDNESATPSLVVNLTGVKSIATGAYHSLAVLESGKAKSWGDNFYGQLGNGTSGNESTVPVNVVGLENVRSISGGDYHSLALLESGRARSWGYNGYGQLGNGTNGPGTDSDVPVAVKNLTNVKNIDGGHNFTLAATQ